jgi:hypothetical protein
MEDRENLPAYAALPRSARRVFAAIGRKSISASLKLLDHLGLIEIEPGPRLISTFRLSNRWRSVDAIEAKRLAGPWRMSCCRVDASPSRRSRSRSR